MCRLKHILICLMALFLSACGNSNSSENKEVTTLKDNVWVDESCKVESLFNSNGNILSTYYKTKYLFTEKSIIERRTNYDKDCKKSLNSYSDNKLSLIYYDLGLKESQNSYDIHDIKIEEDWGDSPQEKDAFYAISHNKLCFSRSIYSVNSQFFYDREGNVAYSYTDPGFYIYDLRKSHIDYERCLLRE